MTNFHIEFVYYVARGSRAQPFGGMYAMALGHAAASTRMRHEIGGCQQTTIGPR
jgi:hypothetical protein